MGNDRMDQVDELIKREIAAILQRYFPESLITVTQVETSKDLSFAKIWITAAGDMDDLIRDCKVQAKDIRKLLAEKVKLRKVPYLQFMIDKTELEAHKIDKLLEEIKKEDK